MEYYLIFSKKKKRISINISIFAVFWTCYKLPFLHKTCLVVGNYYYENKQTQTHVLIIEFVETKKSCQSSENYILCIL